jgi:predicted DNA-binding transcriptional regulator AlpA
MSAPLLRISEDQNIKLADSAKPLVYVAGDIAGKLLVSEKQVRRWGDSGAMPKPIRLGRIVRWNAQVIDDWIAGGCKRPK